MFVVEKNNDIKFTFDDRSVLLQKKNPSLPSSRNRPSYKTGALLLTGDRSAQARGLQATKNHKKKPLPGEISGRD